MPLRDPLRLSAHLLHVLMAEIGTGRPSVAAAVVASSISGSP